MSAWIIWLIVAAVLVLIEVLAQTIWMLCLAIGCVAAAVVSLCGVGEAWQIGVASAVSVLSFMLLLPMFKRRIEGKRQRHESRTGMEALLGRRATVTADIPVAGTGRARIDGDSWQVRAPQVPYAIPAGAEVIVTAYDSIILDVAPEELA